MRKTFTAKSFTGGGEEARKERILAQNQTALGLRVTRGSRIHEQRSIARFCQ
jgi:hypothetical protein